MDWGGIVLFVLFFGWLAYWLLKPKKGPARVCTVCHHHGPSKQQTRGSTGVELVLWLLLIIPGVIYSVWRLSTKRWVCESCGSEAIVPPESPAGKKLLTQQQ